MGIPRKFYKMFNENETETGRVKVSKKMMESWAKRSIQESENGSIGKLSIKIKGSPRSIESIKSRKKMMSIGYDESYIPNQPVLLNQTICNEIKEVDTSASYKQIKSKYKNSYNNNQSQKKVIIKQGSFKNIDFRDGPYGLKRYDMVAKVEQKGKKNLPEI